MEKLGERNYELIAQAVNTYGTYDPDEIYPMFEERLYVDESDTVLDFLSWVHENGKTFGSGNYELVFHEFKESVNE